jgi:hypothetical protein
LLLSEHQPKVPSTAYDKLQRFYKQNEQTINSAGNALASALSQTATPDDLKNLDTAIASLRETSAVLIQGLNMLQELHPFVQGGSYSFSSRVRFDACA